MLRLTRHGEAGGSISLGLEASDRALRGALQFDQHLSRFGPGALNLFAETYAQWQKGDYDVGAKVGLGYSW